jgi:hypothetical protein
MPGRRLADTPVSPRYCLLNPSETASSVSYGIFLHPLHVADAALCIHRDAR